MPTHIDTDQSQGTCAQSVRAFVHIHKLACMPSDKMLLGWEGVGERVGQAKDC